MFLTTSSGSIFSENWENFTKSVNKTVVSGYLSAFTLPFSVSSLAVFAGKYLARVFQLSLFPG
jgi:hypothetical protein